MKSETKCEMINQIVQNMSVMTPVQFSITKLAIYNVGSDRIMRVLERGFSVKSKFAKTAQLSFETSLLDSAERICSVKEFSVYLFLFEELHKTRDQAKLDWLQTLLRVRVCC